MLLGLGECEETDLGRKGARLKWLERKGYRVPRTWVVPASLQSEVLRLSGCDSARDFARQPIVLPDSLARDVADLVRREPGLRFVARSSSNVEDLPFANAAGRYDSYLNLDTAEAILSGIRSCYKSMSSPKVQDYLRQVAIDADCQKIAVLIQEMLSPSWSGVLYGRDPLSPEDVLVEFSPGLGVPVVAGRDATSWAVVDRQTGKVRGELPDEIEGAIFVRVALDLEKEFGGPQDIEWGWSDGLVLFQSRDITTTARRFAEPKFPTDLPPRDLVVEFRPFAHGLSIGRLSTEVAEGTSTLGKVLMVGSDPPAREHALGIMNGLSGVIVPDGGILSHFAALCREMAVPGGVCSPEDLKDLASAPVVVDCDRRVIYAAACLDSVTRKKIVFNWAWTLADRPGLGVTRQTKVEGVIVEGAAVRRLLERLLELGVVGPEVVQVIEPYDFPDRVYCGISARIQHEPGWCRLQFKAAHPSRETSCRRDEEVHVPFDDPRSARQVLVDLGYVAHPVQERALLKGLFEGARLQFNLWPGASGVYVGIEAPDEATMDSCLRSLGLSSALCRGLDGTDLFRMLGMNLEDCRFGRSRPSVAELALRSDT